MDDKGDDIFDRLFSGFFNSGFDKQFQEMNRQMEEMFKHFGDINIKVESFPPGMDDRIGNRHHPPGTSPRDQMLKEPDNEPSNQSTARSSTGADHSDSGSYRQSNRPFVFTSLFGDRGHFSPFGRDSRSDPTPPDCGCQDDNDDSISPLKSNTHFTSSSSSSSTTYNLGLNNGSWSGQTVSTIRHSDGSVEKIVKKTENGRTCTTITKTDPHDVSTSTTTCDRPAIDSGPSTDNLPRVDPPVGPPPQGTKPRDNYDFSDLKKEDASFFFKLFGPRR